MLGTDATRLHKSGAAFLLARFPPATAVLTAPASSCGGSGALGERADLFGAMFTADPSCSRVGAAAFGRARHCLAVVFLALSSQTNGGGNASVRRAVSKGAVPEADKLAADLRGVTVWIGAGQLRRVLAAEATFLHSGGGATFLKTLAFRAVFVAQPASHCRSGAAIL